jgi:hypothetical protein
MTFGADIAEGLRDLDRRIAELHGQGYHVERDRLLEERKKLQAWADLQMRALLARS